MDKSCIEDIMQGYLKVHYVRKMCEKFSDIQKLFERLVVLDIGMMAKLLSKPWPYDDTIGSLL